MPRPTGMNNETKWATKNNKKKSHIYTKKHYNATHNQQYNYKKHNIPTKKNIKITYLS